MVGVDALRVSEVRCTRARPHEAAGGLLAYVAFTINGQVRVDGVVVRRTLEGDHRLSFPSRPDRRGRKHPILRPLSDEARRHLEREVLRQIDPEVLAP